MEPKNKKTSRFDKVYLILATLFGVGHVPLAPGTAGCLPAVLVFILIRNPVHFFIFTVISVTVAFLVSSRAEKIYAKKDCKLIVIDDFSGMLITFLFLPQEIRYIICGFFLFRMLDMLKIPPANIIERYPGSRGVVGDDLIAGIYSNLILQSVRGLLAIIV
ncbi:MAG: phosphatidylglycerophosphatase A [Candidatus Omnitrophica bacterium]|nr:phosphatidylglycerophosphatase A [Candidatus Omnitrophota bacterium]